MTEADDVAAVRAVIDERVYALRQGNVERANAVLANDIVAFEMAPPLALKGAQVTDAKAAAAWLRTWEEPPSIEIGNMEIAASGDVAFAFGFHRLHGRRTSGETVDFWFRSTLCFRKRGGRWVIVHGHSSVPFGGEMRAALDLKP
jgi:ketosteroid isomerase-like protein